MKLYMNQKILSFRDRFSIYNESQEEVYYVEGELLSIGKKLHIYDRNHEEVAFIQQKVLTFLPRFFVFVNGEQVAEIVKEFTFFKPQYRIDGLHWTITGNVFDHDYEIHNGNETMVTIHKKWWSFHDAYELTIFDANDVVNALAVVLAIDCVLDAQAQNNN